MVPKKHEIQILDKETKQIKKFLLRRFENKDVERIFMAWNNPQSYRYNSVDWNKRDVQSLADESWPSSWGMYFMVLEDLENNQIVATCRFGGDTKEKAEKVWDFGYSTFRSDDEEKYSVGDIRDVFKNGVKKDELCWGKGYCSLMLDAIIKFAQDEGVDKLISGADGMNWGSQKVMMKSGFTFYEIEKDGDVDLILKLKDENGELQPIHKPTKEELAPIWEQHMDMVKKAHSRFILRMIVKRNEKKHYYKSLMFLLLTKASEILQTNKNHKNKIELIKQDIVSTFNQFDKNEKRGFAKSFKAYIKRWTKRVGDKDFDQTDVDFYLKCCEIVECSINKSCVCQQEN